MIGIERLRYLKDEIPNHDSLEHYFHALNDHELHAGANELIRFVGSIAFDQL